MSYSKDSNRTEQDLKFRDAQERLRSTLRVREPRPTRIPGTAKRTPAENEALVRQLEAEISIKTRK